ncbi:MAG: HAMP domain-containing protein, partial [Cellulosilyticaceae bacterium]
MPLMFFSSMLLGRLETYFLENSQKDWLSQANLVASQIGEGGYLQRDSNSTYFQDKIINKLSKKEEIGARIVVVDRLGYVVADSGMPDSNSTLLSSQVINILSKKEVNSAEKYEKKEQMIMSTAAAIIDKDNKDEVVGAVVLSANINDIYESLNGMKAQVYLLSLVTSLLVGLLSFFTSSFITRPLKMLMKFVQKVTNGQLDQKVNVRGKDEIAELGNAFNHMAEQLQRVDHTRQEF